MSPDEIENGVVEEPRLFPIGGVADLAQDRRPGIRNPLGDEPQHGRRSVQVRIPGEQQRGYRMVGIDSNVVRFLKVCGGGGANQATREST
jgi:hypothetical protein